MSTTLETAMLPHHSAQRIDKHRTSGYIPGPTESAALQSIASRARAKLRRLQEECSALEQCADECDALLSPIRRLPPEMLGAIFSHYRDPGGPCPGIRIRAVCKIWRDVSRSIPDIWSSVSVPIGGALDARRQKYESLKAHLQDTSYLLSPIFISKCNEPEDLSMFRSLADIADRWKTLYLRNSEPLSHLPLGLILPNLDFLDYACHASDTLSFPTMPKLSSLSLWIPEGQYPFSPASLRLPWEQLRSLRVSGRAHKISDLLVRCPALKSFSMTVTDGLGRRADDMPVALPSQVTSSTPSFLLTVCGTPHPSSLEALLSCTILPAATNVTLAHSPPLSSNVWPERELRLFLSHARSLEELTLIAIPISTNVLVGCLGVTPQIDRLVIEANLAYPFSGRDPRPATINTEALLFSLAQNTPASNDIPVLVPNLTSIEIYDSFRTAGVKEGLIAMVESRWNSEMVRSGTVKQLRCVALRLRDASLIPEMTALLRGFQQQGLDVSVLPKKQPMMIG